MFHLTSSFTIKQPGKEAHVFDVYHPSNDAKVGVMDVYDFGRSIKDRGPYLIAFTSEWLVSEKRCLTFSKRFADMVLDVKVTHKNPETSSITSLPLETLELRFLPNLAGLSWSLKPTKDDFPLFTREMIFCQTVLRPGPDPLPKGFSWDNVTVQVTYGVVSEHIWDVLRVDDSTSVIGRRLLERGGTALPNVFEHSACMSFGPPTFHLNSQETK
jgi:hypothetical protein